MQEENLIEEIRRSRSHFLQLPFDRKIEIVYSVLGKNNGLSHSALIERVNFITLQFSRSLKRDLENIPDRQKLTYRNSANISGRY